MAVREITLPPFLEGQKAEQCLRTLFPGLRESELRRILSARDVKLDGKRISRDVRVHAGQRLAVYLPEEKRASDGVSSLDIVYEDADILLVNKRGDISVEPDARGGVTLTDLCREHVHRSDPEAFSPAACHRLDHRTCGLCLFAKNPEALEILQDVFRQRSLEKDYICLVKGIMKPPAATCRAWLLKDAKQARVQVLDREAPGARPIVTGYETLSAGAISRLRVHLITGRTHQIRAHLAALGHPLLGDDLYGDRALNRRENARSLKLCAVSLKLETAGRLPRLDGRTFTVEPPF